VVEVAEAAEVGGGNNLLTVRYFAGAAAAAGRDDEVLELPEGADVAALRELLGRLHPRLAPVLAVAGLLLDGVAATAHDRALDDVQQVDVLPPFAGG
jgi:molybdopterin converting factor small subunit